jgi:predicted permease
MGGLRRIASKIASAWHGPASPVDFDDEVQAHLRLLAERYERQGMLPEEARRAAHRQFGNVTRIHEERTLAESFTWLTSVSRDLRQAMRWLSRHPAFSITIVSMLALGMGASLIVFTIINALWIRPRPITEPDRVVVVVAGASIFNGGDTSSWTPVGLQRLADSQAFSAVVGQVQTAAQGSAYLPRVVVTQAGRPAETIGATWQYFSMLGVRVRGRDFTPADDRPGAPPVAIVSERLWKRAFGGREDILNQVVDAVPLPLRIVGIAAGEFHGARLGEQADIWVPAHLVPRMVGIRDSPGLPLAAIARLSPGVTPWTAEQMVRQALPGRGGRGRGTVLPLAAVFGGESHASVVMHEESVLRIAGITSALLLLGCCATIAALLLVQYERRRPEFGIRLALGASASRLASQLVLELGVLMIASCALALVVTMWGLHALRSFQLPGGVDLAQVDLTVDWRVLLAAIIGSTVSLLAAAGLPLWRCTRPALVTSLASSGATTTAASHGLRRVLLGVHIVATTVVLISAGVFVRTVRYGLTQGAGFDFERTAFVEVHLRPGGDPGQSPSNTGGQGAAAVERLERALLALPGVEFVTLGAAPLGIDQARWAANPSALAIDVDDEPRSARFAMSGVGPDFFAALGVPLLAGRALTRDDVDPQGSGPIVITESLAALFWPNDSPLGHRLAFPGAMRRDQIVVGVIPDMAYGSLQAPLDGVLFDAVDVRELAAVGTAVPLVIRTSLPDELAADVNRIAGEIGSEVIGMDIATGRDVVNRDLGRQRLGAWFFTASGFVALAIGLCGVFGLVVYLLESRRREFGVRLALGATSGDLGRTVMWFGLEPVLAGTFVGLVGASMLVRTAASLLLGDTAMNPLVYLAAGLLVISSASVAAAVGVARVRRLSLVEVLRVG